MKKRLLINPINVVHDRSIPDFRRWLPEWDVRCIYNPKFPWFAGKSKNSVEGEFLFRNGCVSSAALKDVAAVVLFTAQPRIPSCNLIQAAAINSIPVVVIEETFQMALEQEYVNNYFLPVDRLFAASDYERDAFLRSGVPTGSVETTGCIFTYRERPASDPARKERLLWKFGLSGKKRVASLTIRYLTPHGETAEVRDAIIACVCKGLPAGYELLIKPHPGDQSKNIEALIRRLAPSAKVADAITPFDDILDVTDVLFDRGNSQVVMDALQRNIPVVIVPMGRKTLFHGLADEVIISRADEIPFILDRIGREGMALYRHVFESHLSMKPKDAFRQTIRRIGEVAGNKELYDPARRIVELSLFWAWMGYPRRGVAILRYADHVLGIDSKIAGSLERLTLLRACRDDVVMLSKWTGSGYRQALLQSLWIKSLYMKRCSLSDKDMEWLADYPPQMNKAYFLPFAQMLRWLLLRSGRNAESGKLGSLLYSEYMYQCARLGYNTKQSVKGLVLETLSAANRFLN